ncbi:MAG: DUF6713 family protein [Rubrobacteraceae bacterium]
MNGHPWFILGFCLLLAHEMDAIRAKEWKIFPVLTKMGDEAGYVIFTALHGPVYALLLWQLYNGGGVNHRLIIGLDAFFIVHALLHVILYKHPENRFGSVFSYALISGAGTFGVADLLLSWAQV